MSYELRLKGLKNRWLEIQAIRENVRDLIAKQRFHKKETKSLGQKVQIAQKEENKLLNEYNEAMV